MHARHDQLNSARRIDHDVFVWLAAAVVAVMIVMAAPAICGQFYTHDDLAEFHLPVRAFYAECLADGENFDWMPQLFTGFYLTGEGQGGTYHPLHLLLYRNLPLHTAMSLELLLSYPLMLIGMYFFLRQHIRRRAAALFGGVVFCFSGFNLLHFSHTNAIAVIAHIPWLLLAIHRLLTCDNPKTRAWAMFAIAGLTGSQLLIGYPQYVWFSLLIEAAYAIWLCARAADLLWLVPAKLIGVLLGAVQLLPTWEAVGQSTRQTVDASFATWGSLHPANLVQLVAPYLFKTRVVGENTHELGLYAGAVPLVLVVWLVSSWSHLGRRKPLVIAGLCVAVAAILYAFGKYSLFYEWQTHLPIVGSFRFPCRAIFVFHLAMAGLSAIALAILLTRRRRNVNALAPVKNMGYVVAVACAMAIACPLLFPDYVAAIPFVWAGPLLLAAAAGLTATAARGSRAAVIGLVLLAAADLAAYGVSFSIMPHSTTPERVAGTMPSALHEREPRLVGNPQSSEQNSTRVGNRMLLAGWQRIDGYAGLEPNKQLNYGRLESIRASAAHYVIRDDHAASIEGLRPHSSKLLAVPTPLARIRLVIRAKHSTDPASDIVDIDHATEALVDVPLELPDGVPGTAQLLSDQPGSVDIRCSTSSEQLLVVADSFHPAWRATVDGRDVAVLRVNGDFLGCVVPPGEHLVQLRFQPESLRIGAILTFCGLGLWMSLLVTVRFSKKPASTTTTKRTRREIHDA